MHNLDAVGLRACVFFGLVAAGASACSAKGGDSTAAEGDAADEAGGDGGADANDTGAVSAPTWATLAATFTVSGGEIQATGGALRLGWLDAEGTPLCMGQAPITAVAATAELSAEGVLQWWQLSPGGWSSDCAGIAADSPFVAPFYLGVGELHVEVEARLGDDTVDASLAHALNGAYYSATTDGPVYPFGVVGDAAAWRGEGTALTALPLTDGTWTLEPVYPLP